jgi:hypothetical protein
MNEDKMSEAWKRAEEAWKKADDAFSRAEKLFENVDPTLLNEKVFLPPENVGQLRINFSTRRFYTAVQLIKCAASVLLFGKSTLVVKRR